MSFSVIDIVLFGFDLCCPILVYYTLYVSYVWLMSHLKCESHTEYPRYIPSDQKKLTRKTANSGCQKCQIKTKTDEKQLRKNSIGLETVLRMRL